MSDLIRRQDAIEHIHSLYPSAPIMPMNRKWWKEKYKSYIEAEKVLEMLPSAEPEIIHCGECRYKDDGIDEDGIPFLKCLHGRSYGGTRINDFCSWAKRKNDE